MPGHRLEVLQLTPHHPRAADDPAQRRLVQHDAHRRAVVPVEEPFLPGGAQLRGTAGQTSVLARGELGHGVVLDLEQRVDDGGVVEADRGGGALIAQVLGELRSHHVAVRRPPGRPLRPPGGLFQIGHPARLGDPVELEQCAQIRDAQADRPGLQADQFGQGPLQRVGGLPLGEAGSFACLAQLDAEPASIEARIDVPGHVAPCHTSSSTGRAADVEQQLSIRLGESGVGGQTSADSHLSFRRGRVRWGM